MALPVTEVDLVLSSQTVTVERTNTVVASVYAGGTVGGVVDHNVLDNLAVGDVHTQYALADGSRGNFEAANAVADHEAAADPHTGYLKPSDVIAGANVTVDTTTTPGTVIVASTGGSIDHGGLQGLGDDDHSIYALADGSRGNFEVAGGAAAAVAAHEAAADPHPVYLTEAEGNALFSPLGHGHALGDLPATVATTSLVTSTMSAHTAASDPHPGYLTQAEGDTLYAPASVLLYGEHVVVWDKANARWRFRGQTVTVRPSVAAYLDGGLLVWDTTQDPDFTTPPALAIDGDGWRPHGEVDPLA